MSLDIEKIGDVCNVGDGAHASIKRTLNGIPYYTSKNFKIEGIDLSKVDYISEEDFKKHFRSNSNAITKPIKDDILLSIIGSIGAPHLVKDEDDLGLSSSVSILRPIVSKIEPQFLYYWIKSDDFQNAVHQIKSGVAQSFLSLSMIKQLPVIYPKSLETQKRIASILSNYDDLIENNLKRIKLLEETAQNIYKEWFVNFRFPNYEHTEFDAESGLPVGWENTTLGKVCLLISSGGTPSRNNPNFWNDKDYAWIKTKELQDNFVFDVEEYISKNALENSSAKLFEAGTIIMAIYASPTLGRLGILTRESCFNQASVGFKINEDKISNHFLYYKLIEERKNLNNKAIGAAQQNINVQKVKDHEILLPSKNLIDLFTLNVNDIFTQKRVLGEQNQKLKEARDILLPRLMNRTIEV